MKTLILTTTLAALASACCLGSAWAQTATHSVRIADRLYMRNEYRDSLLTWVLQTPLGPKGEYVYSDMGYYLLQEVHQALPVCT